MSGNPFQDIVWHFGELKSEDELDVNYISQSRHIRVPTPVDMNNCKMVFHDCIHILNDTHRNEYNAFQQLIAYKLSYSKHSLSPSHTVHLDYSN